MRRCINLNELEFYIEYLRDLFECDTTSYKAIIENLKIELGIETDSEELNLLYNPSIEQEDVKLQVSNLGINY